MKREGYPLPPSSTPVETPILYARDEHYIPRVAAVHDLCGYGKCSLGIAIPVLSAAGSDVCPVPTGIFSSHTACPGWYMHDTTHILPKYLSAWDAVDIDIDAVYSGFLGAPEQVDSIKSLYEKYPRALRVVDPVMADHGKVYPTYTSDLCEAMAHLTQQADILTPNLTEAAIILDRTWTGSDISDAEAQDIIEHLVDRGAKYVVLKGIQRKDEKIIRNFVGGINCPVFEVHNTYIPYLLHGTGDLYCSCLLASIMAGHTLFDAVEFAGLLTSEAIEVSTHQPHFQQRGVSFEPLLGKVATLLDTPSDN